MIFVISFTASLILSLVFTWTAKRLASKYRILDVPDTDPERKVHKKPKPLLGGLGIILTFNISTAFFYFTQPLLNDNIPLASMLAIWIGSLILALGGFLDDTKNLKPIKQFIFPVLAVIAVILSGMGVPHITNPFGGRIFLHGPTIGTVGLLSAVFVFMWVLGMIYTTKFLDGLDGLAGTISFVASLTLFALSFTPQVMQDYTALLSAILAGSILGFLIFNWYPAKVFLGEGGSTFLGFILGILAIIAGGKVATAFLVMGVPILDVAWVILRRVFTGKSPFKADRLHLHFRLLDLGLNHAQIVVIFVIFSTVFGSTAVLLQSFGKFISVLILFGVMLLFGLAVVYLSRNRADTNVNTLDDKGTLG